MEQRPLLKRDVVAQKELVQEAAAVERDRLLQAVGTGCALLGAGMPMPPAGLQQIGEYRDVQPVVAGCVELYGFRADVEERWRCRVIANRLAQRGERLTQTIARD